MTDQLTDEAVKALLDGATPGPWRAVMGSRHVVDVFAGDRDVVSVYGSGVGFEYRDANARLIAAAPDLARALLEARAERDRLRADAQAAVALALEAAAKMIEGTAYTSNGDKRSLEPVGPGLAGMDMHHATIAAAIRALANADGLAAVEALRDERDRFEAALGRACLVGGTTYLVERAEKAEAERADEWRRRRDADASRDAAKAACETMRAERDAALARVEKLRHQITEASDPDFILGAMDNVNDMDVTLDGFAQAASRAIRAALAHNGRGE